MATATVNVTVFLKKQEVKNLLLAQESPKYTFVKNKSASEMQFTVEDDGSHGDLVNYTKKVIKSTPWGASLMLRVLYEGQAFSGGKVN